MPLTDDQIVSEWIIRTGQAVQSVQEIGKAINAEQRAEKNRMKALEAMGLAQEQVVASTKKMEEGISELNSGLMKNIAVGDLVSKGVSFLVGKLGELTTETVAYGAAARAYTGDIDAMRRATEGQVSDLALMQAQNKMATLGVRLSSDEYGLLFSAVSKLADAMGTSLDAALDSTATALARQSAPIADNVGAVMNVALANEKYAASLGKTVKQLTDSERKLAFQAEFLEQVTQKAAALPPKLETLSYYLKQMGTYAWNGATQVLDAFNRITAVVEETLDEQVARSARQIVLMQNQLAVVRAIAKAAESFAGIPTSGFAELEARGVEKLDTLRRELEMRGTARTIKNVEDLHNSEMAKVRVLADAYAAARSGGATPTKARAAGGRGEYGKSSHEASGTLGAPDKDEADLLDFTARMQSSDMAKPIDINTDAAVSSIDAVSAVFLRAQEAAANYNIVQNKVADDIQNMGVSALTSFTSALWANFDAWIQGQDSLGMSIAKSLKSVMLSMAAEATVKGIMALADFFMYKDPSYLVAAAKYGVVAALAGGGGLALSAGISASGGYSSSSSSQSTAVGSMTSSKQQSFGKTVEDKAPLYVNIYLNDSRSGLAAEVAARKLGARTVYQAAA